MGSRWSAFGSRGRAGLIVAVDPRPLCSRRAGGDSTLPSGTRAGRMVRPPLFRCRERNDERAAAIAPGAAGQRARGIEAGHCEGGESRRTDRRISIGWARPSAVGAALTGGGRVWQHSRPDGSEGSRCDSDAVPPLSPGSDPPRAPRPCVCGWKAGGERRSGSQDTSAVGTYPRAWTPEEDPMTHGVSFVDEHRHDPHGGRSAVPAAAPGSGPAGMRRAGRVDGRAGHRHR